MQENDLQMGDVFPLLRIALSGAMHGPGVFEMLEVIGKEKSFERLEKALQVFEG